MIFVNDVSNHKEYKKTLLSRIEEYKSLNDTILPFRYTALTHEKESDSKGTVHSDYHIDYRDGKLNLNDFFDRSEMHDILTKIGKDLNLNRFDEFEWEVESTWFQQYYDNGSHCWHTHPKCHFTNIYFLELPKTAHKTEVIGLNNKLYSYEAKEGSLITFPAFLQHRSEPNGSDRKTIISFNTSYKV